MALYYIYNVGSEFGLWGAGGYLAGGSQALAVGGGALIAEVGGVPLGGLLGGGYEQAVVDVVFVEPPVQAWP